MYKYTHTQETQSRDVLNVIVMIMINNSETTMDRVDKFACERQQQQ